MVHEARLTHIALPVKNMAVTKEWYAQYTPLVPVHERLAEPVDGHEENQVLWLGHDDGTPFVIVFIETDDANRQMGPIGHLGIELESEAEVDRIAEMAKADGCLHWEVTRHPPPVGYICAASDPDGNVIEFSFEQGVYAAVAKRRSGGR
jgi:lactoylglutathione lyase